MKKKIVLSGLLLMTASIAFAYGSHYDEPSTFAIVVYLILGIMFFVKLWKACNSINKLKKKYYDVAKPENIRKEVYKLYLSGKENEAFDLLNNAILDKMMNDFSAGCTTTNSALNAYSKMYELIGKEMPERIKIFSRKEYNKII